MLTCVRKHVSVYNGMVARLLMSVHHHYCLVISVLNLFCLHHTHLLARRRSEKDESFVFNKHIQAYYRSQWPSKTASLALSIISYTEVVFELFLSRRVSSKAQRWRWIVGIEGIKYVWIGL